MKWARRGIYINDQLQTQVSYMGSILDPLHNGPRRGIYINDPHLHLNSKQNIYTEDIAITLSRIYLEDIIHSLSIELNVVYTLFNANILYLNVSKMKYMLFGTRRTVDTLPTSDVQIRDNRIEKIELLNILGSNSMETSNLPTRLTILGVKSMVGSFLSQTQLSHYCYASPRFYLFLTTVMWCITV